MSTILHIEQERMLLEKRKNDALQACLVEERKLEQLKGELSSLDGMKRLREQEVERLHNEIVLSNSTLVVLKSDVAKLILERDEQKARTEQELQQVHALIDVETQTRTGLQKDMDTLVYAINQAKEEESKIKGQCEEQGDLLVSLLKSTQEEGDKLTQLLVSQEQEKQTLKREFEVLQTTKDELKKKEEELYQLREDLGIVRDRYAQFARENNLPFNV